MPARRRQDSPSPNRMDRLAEILAANGRNRRDEFKLPKYDGSADVELYLHQFEAIRQANDWTDGAALLHLKCSLEGAATACGRGDTLDQVFQAMRSRFGLSPRQARDKLGQLRYEPNSSLHVLGTDVERLVSIAYPDAHPDVKITLAVDAFTRALNHNALQRHLLLIRIESVADAVRAAQDYFQVGSSKGKSPSLSSIEASVSTTDASPISTMEKMLERLEKQLEANTKAMNQLINANGKRNKGSDASSAIDTSQNQSNNARRPLKCYECGGPHFKRNCPQLEDKPAQASGNESSPQQ